MVTIMRMTCAKCGCEAIASFDENDNLIASCHGETEIVSREKMDLSEREATITVFEPEPVNG